MPQAAQSVDVPWSVIFSKDAWSGPGAWWKGTITDNPQSGNVPITSVSDVFREMFNGLPGVQRPILPPLSQAQAAAVGAEAATHAPGLTPDQRATIAQEAVTEYNALGSGSYASDAVNAIQQGSVIWAIVAGVLVLVAILFLAAKVE